MALTYDAANRLTGVQSAGAAHPLLQAQEMLQYDSFGQLAVRQFPAGSDAYNAGEERRVYLGDDITIVKHTDGTLDAVFHAPFDVDFWGSATAVNGQRSGATYLHRDRLGSVIGVSKQGAVSTSVQWRYTPYGAVDGELDTDTTSCSANRTRPIDARSERGFADTVKLSQGLLLMGARVYDPMSRRFIQADNIDLKRYAYANADPINSLDPSGHAGVGVSACATANCPKQDSDPKPGDNLGPDPSLTGKDPLGDLFRSIAGAVRDANQNTPPVPNSGWTQSADTGSGWSGSDSTGGGGSLLSAASMLGMPGSARASSLVHDLARSGVGSTLGSGTAMQASVFGHTLGVIWGLPQEVVGAVYSLAGFFPGGSFKLAHNGVVVANPIQRFLGGFGSGLTLGHFMNLGGPDSLLMVSGHTSTLGDHEEQHTYQSEMLGPFYLPAHGLSMLAGLVGPGHNVHGDWAFLESGPQSDPPSPWWWR